MDALRRTALRAWPSVRRQSLALEYRTLQTPAKYHPQDRKYVRIAGPTAYASRDDIIEFMQRNGVDMSASVEGKSRRLKAMHDTPSRDDGKESPSVASQSSEEGDFLADPVNVESASEELTAQSSASYDDVSNESGTTRDSGSTDDVSSVDGSIFNSSSAVRKIPLLAQGSSEAFMNISTWYYEAESSEEARDIASKLRGKVCGMKLVRAAPVDQRVVSEVPGFIVGTGQIGNRNRGPDRKREVGLIMPANEERDRCLLVTGLRHMTYPRTVWGLFRGYDIAHVRLLRKAGIASVVFREVSEMERAFRERSNLQVHGHPDLRVGYHC